MKAKEIAEKYGLDLKDFKNYLWKQNEVNVTGFSMDTVADGDVETCIINYVQWLYDNHEDIPERLLNLSPNVAQLMEQKKAADIAAQKRQAALPGIMISSGFSFEGYRIVKYSGYISGDDAIQINRGDLFENAGQNLTDALVLIRAQALKELKEAAYDLGCNAVIGVDFDYLTFEPETANATGGTTYQPYVVCVTANGNAVVIEKEN